MLQLSSKLHRWIALAVSVQVLGWVLGGLVMTALPIGLVHGDNHVAVPRLPSIELGRVVPLQKQLDLAQADDLAAATLKNTPRGPIWVIKSAAGSEGWWNAYTGENVDEITKDEARRYAAMAYKGSGHLSEVRYEQVAPKEAQVSGPLWMVAFEDAEGTRIYLDAFTGEALSRRSNIWQFYDLFYQIHIMNFGASRSYNHPLVVAAAAATLIVVLTGFVLLWFRVGLDLASSMRRTRRSNALR